MREKNKEGGVGRGEGNGPEKRRVGGGGRTERKGGGGAREEGGVDLHRVRSQQWPRF